MRVLFPFIGDSVGGSHNSIIQLYFGLQKTEANPIILIHNEGPLSDFLNDLNIPYVILPIKKPAGENPNIFSILLRVISNFNKIRTFIKKNDIDIVHGNDLRINLTWSLPVKLSKTVYIWHQRAKMSNSLYWNIVPLLANYFIAISDNVYRSLDKHVPDSKREIILNPFDVGLFYKKSNSRAWVNTLYSLPKETILFGYVGRLIEWKNVDSLLLYFSNFIKTTNQPIHLLITGIGDSDYMNWLKGLVRNLGISKQVTFSGFSANSIKVISSLDLMIAPSNTEPFGRTIIEAMLQKVPVLAADGGGHSETISDGVSGYLYSHGDVKSFIQQCHVFLKDKSRCNIIVETAYDNTSSRYSSTIHTRKVIRIYRQLKI